MNITINLTPEDMKDKDIWIAAKVLLDRFAATESAAPKKEPAKKAEPVQAEIPVPKHFDVKEVRAAAAKVAKAKGAFTVKGILSKYDAASVTSLSSEHYEAFMQDLEGVQ